MSDNGFFQQFEKGINALEDLQLLGDHKLTPVVSRALHHMSEMKRVVESRQEDVSSYTSIEAMLEQFLEDALGNYYLSNKEVKQFSFCRDNNQFDLAIWNRIVTGIGLLTEASKQFSIVDKVQLKLKKNNISLICAIKGDDKIKKNRKFLYALTRKSFEQKSLLTFKIRESGKPGIFNLILNLDISDKNDEVYLIDSKKGQFAFNSIFNKYVIDKNEFIKKEKHNIIVIGDDLNVTRLCESPDKISKELLDREIIYLSFLFRPLSIIIPRGGKVCPRNVLSTGCDLNETRQEVSSHSQYIDFFSIVLD